jgi:hypothetical protein
VSDQDLGAIGNLFLQLDQILLHARAKIFAAGLARLFHLRKIKRGLVPLAEL